MRTPFLTGGNGQQTANRAKALAFVLQTDLGVKRIDDRTVDFPEYGHCHFAAFTHPDGAMISTPNRDENFGAEEWHSKKNIFIFRDFCDVRCIVYICEIETLFGLRTIGHHGVKWDDVLKHSKFKKVFKV